MITTNWLNFYTPMEIANEIVNLIPPEYSPNNVVDICAGSGNFLKAASSRWTNINTIGIDISPTDNIIQISKNIHKLDALNLKNLDKINFGTNKLILANPPFGKMLSDLDKIDLSKTHSEIHLEAIRTKRIETLMLVSNLYILKPNDLFAAILPENIFDSANLTKFKKMFLANFETMHLGETKEYFKKSEVKTRIFIGKFILKGDFKDCENNIVKLPENDIKVLRGIDNSKLLKTMDRESIFFDEVVHFSNDEGSIKFKRYIKKNLFRDLLKIRMNDILISRVGRNSGKIHKVTSDYVDKYPSDYFYLLKDFKKIANDNQLKRMEVALLQKKRGLTTRYLCKKDILDQIFLIKNESKK